MSADDLRRAEAEEVFGPALRFAELPLDHVPLDRLGGGDVEERLRRRVVEETGVQAVCGPSGGGKSSVIAAVLDGLATAPGAQPLGPAGRHVLPLRVPVAPAGAGAAEPSEFGRLVIEEVMRAARDVLSGDQRRRIELAAASQTTRRRAAASGRFHFDLIPIPGLNAGLAAELNSGATELLAHPSGTALLGGLRDLLMMLRAHDRWPVLVIEDTDQWAGRPDGNDIADAFFSRIVHALAREVDACTVIAVQDRYRDRPSFGDVRDLVWAIDLPPVTDPTGALRVILCDRIERYLGGPPSVERILDEEALAALAEVYGRTRNLRRTLRVLRDAVELAGPDFPPVLNLGHLASGIAEL